jgi:hypothetical protein
MVGLVFDNETQEIRTGAGGGIKLDPGASDLVTIKSGAILPDGSLSEPALRFADDTNTGLYSPENEQVAVVGDGAVIALFDGTDGSVTISGNKFPTGTGTDGQVLSSDGAGQLSWVTPSAGGGGDPSETFRFVLMFGGM